MVRSRRPATHRREARFQVLQLSRHIERDQNRLGALRRRAQIAQDGWIGGIEHHDTPVMQSAVGATQLDELFVPIQQRAKIGAFSGDIDTLVVSSER
jgi:hypothetical protein